MKLLPFLMPGFPSIGASRDVFRFLQGQKDVIVETALPTLAPSGSTLVQKVRKTVNRAGIRAEDVMATFRKDRKTQSGMLMLHTEPDGHQFSQILTAFDYAIAPFDAKTVTRLNQTAARKEKNDALFPATQFGAQIGPNEMDADVGDKVRASAGFVYLKVAHEREGELFEKEKIQNAIEKIKAISKTSVAEKNGQPIAVYCGYGVKTADDVRMLKKAGADGVFLGAAALQAQEKGPKSFEEFWDAIKVAATD
ncbi:tryptophan synthase subunit alpha [Candidatus Micrarchaeota archaeon]|nr:tryptophan synthase subunit alpha [Candidatus Micrarchaeota archaeon]